jgi:insulysin
MCHYRPDLIEMVMEKLVPEYLRLGILSQKFKGKTDLVEPWYGSAYSVHRIDAHLIEMWSAVEPIPELCLPKPNEFIPTDFSIVSKPKEMAKTPVLIKVCVCVCARDRPGFIW